MIPRRRSILLVSLVQPLLLPQLQNVSVQLYCALGSVQLNVGGKPGITAGGGNEGGGGSALEFYDRCGKILGFDVVVVDIIGGGDRYGIAHQPLHKVEGMYRLVDE